MKLSKIALLFVMFILLSTPVFAFLSPSTITLVANSISAFLWGAVVLIAVHLVLLFKKIGKKTKRGLNILTFVILVILFIVFIQRYVLLKELNDVYDDIDLMENELDLDKLTPQELSEYKLFQMQGKLSDYAWISNVEKVMPLFPSIVSKLFDNSPDKFAKMYNITKEDKILFVCETGVASRHSMNWLRSAGYNASFARLVRVQNPTIFTAKYRQRATVSSKLIIVPYKGQDDLIYVDVGLYLNENYLGNFTNKVTIIPPENATKEMLLDHNIVCSVNLHCVLTKYFLDSHDIDRAKIYKIPVSEKVYNDPENVYNDYI